MLFKKDVFKYFAKFTGCEVCEIFKNTFFTEHLRATASETKNYMLYSIPWFSQNEIAIVIVIVMKSSGQID